GLAIAQGGQVGRHVQPFGALADAGDQDFLLAADQRVEVSLRNAGPRRDLERAGRGVAALHEGGKGRLQDARAHCRLVAASLAAPRCRRPHHPPLDTGTTRYHIGYGTAWYQHSGALGPMGGQMSMENIFRIQLVLGYVAWLLCFRAYILPWLKSMDR